jgi:hypothetical protein
LLICAYLEKPSDAAATTPEDRLKRLARDVGLPACAKLAPHAKEIALEQIAIVVLQPCTDPKAEGKSATKAEMILCAFPIAELERFAKKEADEKAVFQNATVMFLGRDDKMMAKSDVLKK